MAISAHSPTSVNPPTETPPGEGCIAEAHVERADGGIWEHPALWAGLVLFGSLVFGAYFIARIFGFS